LFTITNTPPSTPHIAPTIKLAGRTLKVGATTLIVPNFKAEELMSKIPVWSSEKSYQMLLNIAKEKTARAQVKNTFQIV
jgi:hypothetical protein